MVPSDIVSKIEIIERETEFTSCLKMRIGDKYLACDIFATRGLNAIGFTGFEIGNFIRNMRALCDTIEANYE